MGVGLNTNSAPFFPTRLQQGFDQSEALVDATAADERVGALRAGEHVARIALEGSLANR